MKDVIIIWNKTVFDGEKRLLPNKSRLYTQIYFPNKDSYSLVIDFEETPRDQGYESIGKVHFLIDNAPEDILVDNFEFDFLDGRKKIGVCKII